jgi:hypothetical protein
LHVEIEKEQKTRRNPVGIQNRGKKGLKKGEKRLL